METYSEHHTAESNDTCPEVRTLSLLTLADLAVALQDQGDDHNYALLQDPQHVIDKQCLLIKEKDHNYSSRSKTELRGRAKYTDTESGAKSIIMKKSSSEENLTSISTSDCQDDIFSPISKKSNSCEQVVAQSFTNSSQLCKSDDSNSNLSKLCSSWPKENTFKEFVTDSIVQQIEVPNVQRVCDHTYARDKVLFRSNAHGIDVPFVNSAQTERRNELFQTEHNYDIRRKFSFNNPRKIDVSKKSKVIMKGDNVFYQNRFRAKEQQQTYREQIIPQLSKDKLFDFDHNYTYRTTPVHQTSGSIESLDMDLSESETDSCEETEQVGANFYSQLKNTQLQDHPYSKSGILSF